MNNFAFLNDKPEYRSFSKDCVDAEKAFQNSYDSCVKLVRTALDAVINTFDGRKKVCKDEPVFDAQKIFGGEPHE